MRAPEFWGHAHGPRTAPLIRSLLTPLSWLVTGVGRWRHRSVSPTRVSVPVICLGNVTMGGTGKTPLAIALASMLQKAGHKPAILLRGFGGKAHGPLHVDTRHHDANEVGDEALLLARCAPTFVCRNRAAGAVLAIAQGANVIIMDDGFQNPSLAKDLCLLVLDADAGLGNEHVFPAGPLREPLVDALGRADALIIMGTGTVNLKHDLPVFQARLHNPLPPPTGPLMAFAGIGRPAKFFDALRKEGADLVQEIAFDDHHKYSTLDIKRLSGRAALENARLITTEKDFVRLPEPLRAGIYAWPVEAHFEYTDTLMALLAPVLPKGTPL